MGDVHFLDVGCADASIITTDTATFLVYDARGRRVRKTVGGANTDFIYGLSGNVVAEWGPGCGSSCWTVGYVYANGSLLAEYQSRTTFFVHKDHLGSTRMLTRMCIGALSMASIIRLCLGVTSRHAANPLSRSRRFICST